MSPNTHYTITYNDEPCHCACKANVDTLEMNLVANGTVKHYPAGSPLAKYVDLLTVYFTPVDPPESFTLKLNNGGGYTVQPIYPAGGYASGAAINVTQDAATLQWTLTITGPTSATDTGVYDFQLFTSGPTPPQKLKIRVKRQATFSCGGPYDDVWGGEIPNP